MVVEICKKLPLTMANTIVNPCELMNSPWLSHSLSIRPAGEARLKMIRQSMRIFRLLILAFSTDIKAIAAGILWSTIPMKV